MVWSILIIGKIFRIDKDDLQSKSSFTLGNTWISTASEVPGEYGQMRGSYWKVSIYVEIMGKYWWSKDEKKPLFCWQL